MADPISSTLDEFVPDPVVAQEFRTTLMALWRWDHDDGKIDLGWPPKLKIGRRNYRSRKQLEAFKANLIRRALAEREGRRQAAFDAAAERRGAAAEAHLDEIARRRQAAGG